MSHVRTITYRGETFGTGTDIGIVALRGLESLDVPLNTPILPRYHGGIVGSSFALPRILEVELRVRPSTRQRALSVFQPEVDTENELAVSWDDENEADLGDRVVFCRPSRRGGVSRDRTTEFSPHTLIVELIASDPAVYGAEVQIILSPQALAEGLSYPVTYPKQYGAAGTSGEEFPNSGDWETWPVYRINGPSSGTLTDPSIIALGLDKTLALTANGGVAITAGQTLEISTHPKNRYVRFLTGASRYGRLSSDSEFFALPVGVTELRFQASGDTVGSSVEVSARPAWI